MTRQLIQLTILLTIALVAFGCAPAPAAPAAENVRSATDQIVLKVGTGDSGKGLEPHRQIIAEFEKANPGIRVEIDSVVESDYYGHLMKEIQDGTAPDIMQIGDDAVPMFVQKGAFVDLGPYMRGSEPLDQGIYLSGLLQPGQWNGGQYFLPKDFTPLAVYYNKKIFDQWHVPYPKDGWNWNDFLRTAQRLTIGTIGGGTQIWGVQLPGAWTSGFEYWVAALGGSLVSEDGKSYTGYMDSNAAIDAFRFYTDLYNTFHVAPPPKDLKAFQGGNDEFARGRAAMWVSGHWPEADLRNNPNIDLGVVGMPVYKERANTIFWSGFGIYSGSKNKQAAWRFLRFYAGAEGAQVWKDWGLPTVKSVADSSGMMRDPIESVWLNELNYLAPRAYIFSTAWGEKADPALRNALEEALTYPNADASVLMHAAAQQAQNALAQEKNKP